MAQQWNSRWFLGDKAIGIAAAGTTQGTATTLTADHVKVSTVTTSANGVVLKESPFPSLKSVSNADADDNLKIYPWSGASFNGKTANDPLEIVAGGGAIFLCLSATDITAIF